MKTFVLFGVIASALAAPVPDDHEVVVAHHAGLVGHGLVGHGLVGHGLVGTHGLVGHGLVAGHGLVGAVGQVGLVGAAVAPVQLNAQVHTPVVSHVPAVAQVKGVAHAVEYTAPQLVNLPPKEVKVPITKTHVEVPVHQKVHYGTEAFVSGATTTIHKPSLSAPAIAPPSTLLSHVTHHAPEVTHVKQEIPVQKNVPNFVDTPFHAGTIVKYTEPEVKEVKVPTPVAKPVAVPVQVPYAQPVPVPHPVPVHAGTQYHHHAVAPVATGAVTAYAGHGLVAGQGLVAGHGLVGHGLVGHGLLPVAAAVVEE